MQSAQDSGNPEGFARNGGDRLAERDQLRVDFDGLANVSRAHAAHLDKVLADVEAVMARVPDGTA
jgi:hypothetical protein